MNMLFERLSNPISIGAIIQGKWNGRKYRIKRKLGAGENGIVYLVDDFIKAKQYALKMSTATIDLSYEIQVIQRLNEAQGPALGFSIYDIDDLEYKGNLYTFYVMPYQKGISIKQYLEGRSTKDYLEVFQRVIRAVSLLHKEGWIYGDLKPEHLMIDPYNMMVSIIDYGGVTAIGEGVRQYTEQYDRGAWRAGNRRADQHYDLFSIVMVFIRIVLGKQKFERIWSQPHSMKQLCDIIRNITKIKPLIPIFLKVIKGNVTKTDEMINELTKTLDFYQGNGSSDRQRHWIDWFLTSSLDRKSVV